VCSLVYDRDSSLARASGCVMRDTTLSRVGYVVESGWQNQLCLFVLSVHRRKYSSYAMSTQCGVGPRRRAVRGYYTPPSANQERRRKRIPYVKSIQPHRAKKSREHRSRPEFLGLRLPSLNLQWSSLLIRLRYHRTPQNRNPLSGDVMPSPPASTAVSSVASSLPSGLKAMASTALSLWMAWIN